MNLQSLLNTHSFEYVLLGFFPILIHLLATGRAKLSGNARYGWGCPDTRVDKKEWFFGGPAGMTFGLGWFLMGWLVPSWRPLFVTYGWFQFVLSLAQWLRAMSILFRGYYETEILFKAHLQGCAYTTAWSPFWWLYWVGKIKLFKPLVTELRDMLTRIDCLFSLPGLLILEFLAFVITGVWLKPVIMNVEHPHDHESEVRRLK